MTLKRLTNTSASPLFVTPAADSNRLLPLIALGLVLAAWVAVILGEERVSRLDLSGWGTNLDIPERLAIDAYCSRHFLPYIRVAVLLDLVALVVLLWANARGRFRILGVLVSILWFASVVLHCLNWMVTSFFAG